MSPSYIAFPTITPSILFKFLAFLISLIDETPPDITNGQFEISATFCVSSISDIKRAKNLNNIEGVIVGKAIYDGDIKLDELAKEIDA